MTTGRVQIQAKSHYKWKPKFGKNRAIDPAEKFFELVNEHHEDVKARHAKAEENLAALLEWQRLNLRERRQREKPALLARYNRPPSVQLMIEKARGVAYSLKLQVESPLIFPGPEGQVTVTEPRPLGTIIEKAGLAGTGVSMHVLRHTFASHLVQNNVSIMDLKELMGHQDIDTTMRYAHLSPHHAAAKGRMMPKFEV